MVPKCVGCPYFKDAEALSYRNRRITTLVKSKICTNPESGSDVVGSKRKAQPVLHSSEYRTSPKWCPLRESK